MNGLFAMAGLAEAAFAQQLLICWAGLVVIGAFLIAAGIRRSQGVAGLVVGLSILFGAAFEPWSVFQPISGDDPDLVYWVGRYRVMATAWLAMLVVAIVLIFLFRTWRRVLPASQS